MRCGMTTGGDVIDSSSKDTAEEGVHPSITHASHMALLATASSGSGSHERAKQEQQWNLGQSPVKLNLKF